MAVIDLVEITILQKSQSNGVLDWLFFFLTACMQIALYLHCKNVCKMHTREVRKALIAVKLILQKMTCQKSALRGTYC